jgi:hypothetical protein
MKIAGSPAKKKSERHRFFALTLQKVTQSDVFCSVLEKIISPNKTLESLDLVLNDKWSKRQTF